MLWLALYFPALGLQIHTRGSATPVPLAVVETHARRTRVNACSAQAAERGVRPGMLASAAQALAEGLIVRPRDRQAEQAALEGLAVWAGRFTPGVSLDPPEGLVLEIGSCLRLHGGLQRLLRLMQYDLERLGYRHTVAYAPTPAAAGLLARATPPRSVEKPDDLLGALSPLPVHLLPLPEDVHTHLERIGVSTLGACLRLPRAGFARRFGQSVLDAIDRALGRLPEARAFHVVPPRFRRRLELPSPVEHAEALQFAARRLLPELESHLLRHQAGVQHLDFICHHEYREATRLALGFVKPQRGSERIAMVLRETLARTRLAAPVEAIEFAAEHLLPLAGHTTDLFARTSEEEGGPMLLERLRARLGPQAIFGVSVTPDHRPEHAWTRSEVGRAASLARPVRRPLWLLARPRRCPDGELILSEGPERIASGWWEGSPVERDYYIARNRQGARLWVYCERASGEWFIHGIFA